MSKKMPGGLPDISESCVFSDEITSGVIELNEFAVELYEIISGTASSSYTDPEKFLENTHLTEQMRRTLANVLKRTQTGEGVTAQLIDTGFGGGKSHTLALLYHVFNNPEIGNRFIKSAGISDDTGIGDVSGTKVAAIDCRAIKKKTLWGEVAARLGRYDVVEKFDRLEEPITDISIIQEMIAGRTIIMIDELPSYLIKQSAKNIGGTTLAKLTIQFLYDLVSAVSSTKNAYLVVTVTEKQHMFKEESDKIKGTMNIEESSGYVREGFSRQGKTVTPISESEIYDVVRKRLVKSLDKSKRDLVVGAYMRFYLENGLVTNVDTEENLSRAYPFHPHLIRTVYDRLGTIPYFNKTRGMLRLLALVIHDITKSTEGQHIVSAGDINMHSRDIMEALSVQLDMSEYQNIIETDCNGHAVEIDNELHNKTAERISRAIYLYSLHKLQARKSGISISGIKMAISRPGDDLEQVEKTVEKFKDKFWHMRESNGEYYFVSAPNINRIINEHSQKVDIPEIEEKIKNEIRKISKGDIFRPVIWDHSVPDKYSLQVCIMKHDIEPDNALKQAKIVSEYVGDSPRKHKNMLVFMHAEPEMIVRLKDAARHLVAIEKAKKDERITADKQFNTDINTKLEQACSRLQIVTLRTYSRVIYPVKNGIKSDSISEEPTKAQLLHDVLVDFCMKKGRLVDSLSPDAIIVDDAKTLEAVFNEFTRVQGKSMVTDTGLIMAAAVEAVKTGLLMWAPKLVEREGRYVAASFNNDISFSSYLLNPKKSVAEADRSDEETTSAVKNIPDASDLKRYTVSFESLDGLFALLNSLVIGGFKDTKKVFRFSLRSRYGLLFDVSEEPSDLTGAKSMLERIRNDCKLDGAGILELSSKDDIRDRLDRMGIEYE